MNITEISLNVLSGGQSQKLALSTTSASSATITANSAASGLAGAVKVVFTPDVDCFVRYDPAGNPTALADGTDQLLLAGNTYRTEVAGGGKFAFILAVGAGNVYITPGA